MKNFKICLLSKNFYDKYSNSGFPELLKKGENRPYLILVIKIDNNLFGLPLRSNIKHKYCFKFNNSTSCEGIDYTKAVVLSDGDIGKEIFIKTNKYIQINEHIDLIVHDFKSYYDKVKRLYRKETKTNTQKFITYSTLPYFIDELKK